LIALDSTGTQPMETDSNAAPSTRRTASSTNIIDDFNPLQLQIKPLISSTTRTYRQLAELFATLSKSCQGGGARPRRGHEPTLSTPSADALQLADALFVGCKEALEWQPPVLLPQKLRYVLICLVSYLPCFV